jgi:hypothetical protein
VNLAQRRLTPCSSPAEYLVLFRDCFPETLDSSLCSERHYRWKYGAEGKAAPVFEFAACDGARMVGYYAALPFHYRTGPGTVIGGMVCDVMTHSSTRGQGVFTKQGFYATKAMADAGVSFVLGFPIRSYVFPGHIKVGWHVAFGLPVYFRLADARPALQPRRLGWMSPVVNSANALYRAALRLFRSDAGECERSTPEACFPAPEYIDFYRRWSAQNAFHLARTPDFFRWRLRAPESNYTVIRVRKDGQLVALAVTRRTTMQGLPILAVVDIMVLTEFRHAVGRLHEETAKLAREAGAAAVIVMVPRPQARSLRLARNGFFRSPVEFKLILKWLADGPPPDSFSDASAWHLTWADTDSL